MKQDIIIPEKLEKLFKKLEKKSGDHKPEIVISLVQYFHSLKSINRQDLINFSDRNMIKKNDEDTLSHMLILCKDFELGEHRSVKKKDNYFPFRGAIKDNQADYYVVKLEFHKKPYRGGSNEVISFYTEDQDLVFKLIGELLKDKIKTNNQRYLRLRANSLQDNFKK